MGLSSPLQIHALNRDPRVRQTCLLSGLQNACQWPDRLLIAWGTDKSGLVASVYSPAICPQPPGISLMAGAILSSCTFYSTWCGEVPGCGKQESFNNNNKLPHRPCLFVPLWQKSCGFLGAKRKLEESKGSKKTQKNCPALSCELRICLTWGYM